MSPLAEVVLNRRYSLGANQAAARIDAMNFGEIVDRDSTRIAAQKNRQRALATLRGVQERMARSGR